MLEIERVREKEREKEIEREKVCPECGSFCLVKDYKRGELYCQDCGLVIEDKWIDEGPEWRSFDKEKRSRVGAPITPLMFDKGLSTTISIKDEDYSGRSLSLRNKAQFFRLRKWQRRMVISSATKKNFAFALSQLNRIATEMGLPKSVREDAALIYRKIHKERSMKGESVEIMVPALLYLACRKVGIPRTLEEIATYSSVEREKIFKAYKLIIRELGLKIPPLSAIDYIPKFCNMLGIKGEVQEKAVAIIKKAEEKGIISGKSPLSLAAAAIYIAAKSTMRKITQREIAEVAGVTEVTIRNRYKELKEKLGILFVPKRTKFYPRN